MGREGGNGRDILSWSIINADARAVPLKDKSVQCIVTSPPYWGLRDYGTATWVGGDEGCDHHGPPRMSDKTGLSHPELKPREQILAEPSRLVPTPYRGDCGKCGATRIDSQIGLEKTPEEYVAKIVAVFREVKRILRDDGVAFVNLGDSYSTKEYARIRDYEKETFFRLPMAIRQQVFDVWRQALGESVSGDVRKMLSSRMETEAPRANESARQKILREPQGDVSFANSQAEQIAQSGDDSISGRQVRVLRGNGTDVSLSGPYQGRRSQGVSESGWGEWSLETGNPRGIKPEEVSDSLLELQRRAWALWQVHTLSIDLADIPRQARCLFDVILKPKDLCMIPARVALALQCDGWYVRSDIIWSKCNPMPESVTDRPTKAHEYIFLLSKKERYFFDQDAVREAGQEWGERTPKVSRDSTGLDNGQNWNSWRTYSGTNPAGRNIRTVWEIATQPYPEAHFATFPEEIAVRCIKAGTSEKGACTECGAPWERTLEATGKIQTRWAATNALAQEVGGTHRERTMQNTYKTTGWQPTCEHDAPATPCVVLDPFSGAGTVPLVADKLNRRGIGLELKADYCRMANRRCYDDAPLLS